MESPYLVKSSNPISIDAAKELIEAYEQSVKENKAVVVRNDIELYKLKRGKYIRIF